MGRKRSVLFLVFFGGAAVGVGEVAACSRAALEATCPALAAGELVITEIRGQQTGADELGQWIELENASGASVDLEGLEMHFQKLDGSAPATVVVRARRVVAAGAYAGLGRFPAGDEPAYVTYGFAGDFPSNLYAAGTIDLIACDVLIDRVSYADLPGQGSLALDGSVAPDAVANDDPQAWCVDAGGDGHPGTPLERNPACAP